AEAAGADRRRCRGGPRARPARADRPLHVSRGDERAAGGAGRRLAARREAPPTGAKGPLMATRLVFSRALAFAAALLAAVVAGCGGGVDSGGTGAQPTSFASGPITGFGSVIVNAVHYDDGA